jgi:ubiquitin carboxyl-terminal hydrolase 7
MLLFLAASFEFTRPRNAEVIDQGFKICFPLDILLQNRWPDGSCTVRCELLSLLPTLLKDSSSPQTASKLATGMIGLDNLGATCYLNALLQMLFHINMLRKEVYNIPHEHEEMATSTTLALQSVFYKIQTDSRAVSTVGLMKSFGWDSADAFQQQDVQEMMRVLIDKLEECMKGTPREHALKNTFSGTIKSYIRCLNMDYVSEREEDFYDIQLDVAGNKDIYASLDKYIEKEILSGENQYDAGEGRGKQDAEKGVIFTKFPPVFTVHLKRFAFDMEKMGFTKVHDKFEYPLVLDLSRYVSTDVAQVIDPSEYTYRLHSVLVHSGEVYGGHYYAYIRAMSSDDDDDTHSPSQWLGTPPGSGTAEEKALRWRQKRGKWFKFDDENVSYVDESEAVEKCFGRESDIDTSRLKSRSDYIGSLSSAYMLVYIRENDANEV